MKITASNYDAWTHPEIGPTQVTVNRVFNSSNLNLAQQGVELVVINPWAICRAKVTATSGQKITVAAPLGWADHSALGGDLIGRVCYLENAQSYITNAGDWSLNRQTGVLAWKAGAGQTPSNMTFRAPVASQLVVIQGTASQPVRNLQFIGLRFMDTAWDVPDTTGYNEIQATMYGTNLSSPWRAVPAGVQLTHARNCRLEACRFENFGAGGVGLGEGCTDNVIIGCTMQNIGGNGIVVGQPSQPYSHNWVDYYTNTGYVPYGNVVIDNTVKGCGQVQYGAVGIFIGFIQQSQILHNDVSDVPYTGISCGWCWDGGTTNMSDNTVAYNNIHNVMALFYDGAGIYTLGSQPNTFVHHNYVHDILYGHGLYTDQGSRYITYENNVFYHPYGVGLVINCATDLTVRNNIFAYSGRHPLSRGIDAGWTMQATRNIFYAPTASQMFEGPWNDSDFSLDYNLYWSLEGGGIIFPGSTNFAQWQATGRDVHSLVADPKFANLGSGDFTIPANSPAYQVGFQPIDLSQVGVIAYKATTVPIPVYLACGEWALYQ